MVWHDESQNTLVECAPFLVVEGHRHCQPHSIVFRKTTHLQCSDYTTFRGNLTVQLWSWALCLLLPHSIICHMTSHSRCSHISHLEGTWQDGSDVNKLNHYHLMVEPPLPPSCICWHKCNSELGLWPLFFSKNITGMVKHTSVDLTVSVTLLVETFDLIFHRAVLSWLRCSKWRSIAMLFPGQLEVVLTVWHHFTCAASHTLYLLINTYTSC